MKPLLILLLAVPAFADDVFIQVRFKIVSGIYEYQDALYFTEAAYAATKPEDIEAMKQARFDAWLKTVQNPPPVVEPTKAELEVQAAELQRQLDEVNAKIAEQEVKEAQPADAPVRR